MSRPIHPSSSSVDAMTAEDALAGLYEAYWRMQNAIGKKIREDTEGLPEFLRESVAEEVRATCFPEEKALWTAAYQRVMSALIRHGLEHGVPGYERYGDARETMSGVAPSAPVAAYHQISLEEEPWS